MSVLNHLAQAAAVILLVDVIVVVVIFLAVAGGLAFGLHWVNGKIKPTAAKAHSLEKRGAHYVDLGLDYSAKPIIVIAGNAERLKATLEAIRRRARQAYEATTRTPSS